jgi:hypothetical protein
MHVAGLHYLPKGRYVLYYRSAAKLFRAEDIH